MQVKTFNITQSQNDRIDVYLATKLDLTRSHIKKLCDMAEQ